MKLRRSGGILLHISSLPCDEGIVSLVDGAVAVVISCAKAAHPAGRYFRWGR
jgi:hypothetical protein